VDGLSGLEVVAHVIQNRVAHPSFPKDASSVVALGTDQFQKASMEDLVPHTALDQELLSISRHLATQLVKPPHRLQFSDPTRGALYFDWRRPASSHGIRDTSGTTAQESRHNGPRHAGGVDGMPSGASGIPIRAGAAGSATTESRPAATPRSKWPMKLFRERSVAGLSMLMRLSSNRSHDKLGTARCNCRPESSRSPTNHGNMPSSSSSSSRSLPGADGVFMSSGGIAAVAGHRLPGGDPVSGAGGSSSSRATLTDLAGSASRPQDSSAGVSDGSTSPPQAPWGSVPVFSQHQLHAGRGPGLRGPQTNLSLHVMEGRGPGNGTGRVPPSAPRRGLAARHRVFDYDHGAGMPSRSMVLPCGLCQDEVIDIMYRDLRPEDFDTLLKLDERLPKRHTATVGSVERLPRHLARDCRCSGCRVCLTDFEASTSVVELPCGHAFHPACISKWLTQFKNNCPICATPAIGGPPTGSNGLSAPVPGERARVVVTP